jgi:hypothetical protein
MELSISIITHYLLFTFLQVLVVRNDKNGTISINVFYLCFKRKTKMELSISEMLLGRQH